jgi:hypothetical protein
MSDSKIVCPKCGNEFGDALAHQIEERIRAQYDRRARTEMEEVRRDERKRAEEELTLKIDRLAADNGDLKARLRTANQKELELLRLREELDRKREEMELEMARRLADERGRVKEEVRKQAAEESELKLAQQQKLVDDLRRQMEDMRRRVEQGSQQEQGEIFELEIERLLRERFPGDRIDPVPKGVRGADVVQEVMSPSGQPCGRILWELKRTKSWSAEWVPKLKEDMLRVKADVAAIVSTALPRDVRHFGEIERVWISDFPTAIGMAIALRAALIERASAVRAMSGQASKMDSLYKYLLGPEFRQRIEGLLTLFRDMKKDLEQERAAMMKMHARRDKQIDQFMEHTARLYGDMQGIGAGLPEIPGLMLPGAEQLPLLDGKEGE